MTSFELHIHLDKCVRLLSLFFFILLIVGFTSCTNHSNSLNSEETITTRNTNESTYESIAHLLTNSVDTYNETFEVDEIYLNIIEGVIILDDEKIENELEYPLTSEQEQVVDEINEDLQILVDLISSVIDDGLTAREIEEISMLLVLLVALYEGRRKFDIISLTSLSSLCSKVDCPGTQYQRNEHYSPGITPSCPHHPGLWFLSYHFGHHTSKFFYLQRKV